MIRALRAQRHEVLVLSPHAGLVAADGALTAVSGLVAGDPAAPRHLDREVRALMFSERLGSVRAQLAAFAPDAVYERYALFAYGGGELARALGVPHLLEVNAPLCEEQATHRALVLRRTAEELEARILSGADAVLPVSSALAEHARRLGVPDERIAVSPNGVDPERFDPAISGAAVRARHGLVGKTVIGFVGSLRPWHDLDALLRAVERLPDVHLLVVGDGPRRAELAAGERVQITGAVEHALVPGHLAAMDVAVVPYGPSSGTYFSPLKLFEAMAMGRPVVAARLGQVGEALEDGRTGLLYEPGSDEDLRARIAQVLAAPDRGAALGAAAREAVLARWTWAHAARRVEDVVFRVKAGGGHRDPARTGTPLSSESSALRASP